MDRSDSPSRDSGVAGHSGDAMRYRRDSMRSSVSAVSDVEMAHDEVFSGPMSESIPSSVASFAHRRSRHDSTVSFTFFQQPGDISEWLDEEAVEEASDDDALEGRDVYPGSPSISTRTKHGSRSRSSVEYPLLGWNGSTGPYAPTRKYGDRVSQKIYIVTEDLTAVVTGFSTTIAGFILYIVLCLLSGGIAYLLFRWLPRWRIRIIGSPTPLETCQWVAVENDWGQFTTHSVSTQPYGHALSTVFGSSNKRGETPREDEDDEPILVDLRFLEYRYIRFCYHPVEDKFMLNNDWKDPSWKNVKNLRNGLDADERDRREQVFGANTIEIEQKPIPQLLVEEAFHPFYVFQVASLILWSMDEYYYYAACIFLISLFSISATVVETRSTLRRLIEISHFECDVRVMRSGFCKDFIFLALTALSQKILSEHSGRLTPLNNLGRSMPSSELVPGDVYEMSDPSLTQVPCDCLLLAGDCIINESMLTGESVPVSKIPTTNEALDFLDLSATSAHPILAKHFLFSGTKIIRARRPQDSNDDEAIALAMVVRTGFNTTKGSLVRSMLFPKPSGFKFYRDSFRYISVMGVVACFGFIASFINFVRLGLPWHTIFVRALDLVTIVVPPALPATLTIGTNFALSRLKKQQIFCISPQRVNVGGKLDVVCFDKTGTLTEDGLDVLGVQLVYQPGGSFGGLLSEPRSVLAGSSSMAVPGEDCRMHNAIIHTMATCHSLREVDGELIGDPLDLKMFQFTGWLFKEGNNKSDELGEEQDSISPSVARPPADIEVAVDDAYLRNWPQIELGVLRSFEFVSQLRRASVIVRQFKDPGASIFVKGAPECMRDICVAESLPADFDELLAYYTHRGYRVIACATKYLRKLSWMKVQKMSREEAESELEFVGFIIFENKLKPNTEGIIRELGAAGIRNIMCTGDNILTAVSVARGCGLLDSAKQCYIPRFIEGDSVDPESRLSWESVDNPAYRLDEKTLMPLSDPDGVDISVPHNNYHMYDHTIAVSGEIFRWIVDYGSEQVLNGMLVRGQVYARMSPDEKHELVEKLQSIDYCCGFCGDGANDCGALKAADVGISLSEAEASVAAPFTSRVFDISCVPKLIREGRASLVTSFSCFKYMSLYSAIQFTSVSFLYGSASNLGDFQFLFIDLALILPIAIFMGWTGPFPILCQKRPTANLFSLKVLVPLLGQMAICVLVQFAVFKAVQAQPWYKPPKLRLDKPNIENSENTSLFLISCYQYILSAIVLGVGPPFRQSMTSNVPFIVTIVVALLFTTYMLIGPSDWLFGVMQLTKMSAGFKEVLLCLAIGGFALSRFAETRVFPTLARFLGRFYHRLRFSGGKKQRRRYKILLDNI